MKNSMVNSAFLAAEDAGRIYRGHTIRAAKRAFQKIGKYYEV